MSTGGKRRAIGAPTVLGACRHGRGFLFDYNKLGARNPLELPVLWYGIVRRFDQGTSPRGWTAEATGATDNKVYRNTRRLEETDPQRGVRGKRGEQKVRTSPPRQRFCRACCCAANGCALGVLPHSPLPL